MRLAALIITLFICQFSATAQQKQNPPATTQVIPDKDPVVTIDNIAAGKSKRYHWHSPQANISISKPSVDKSCIDVTMNGKTVFSRYKACSKAKSRKLKLTQSNNLLIISPSKSYKSDSFTVYMLMTDKTNDYNITIQLKKGKSDTLIIIKH